MAGFYIGRASQEYVDRGHYDDEMILTHGLLTHSFILFRIPDQKRTIHAGELELHGYLRCLRDEGDVSPVFDHFPEDHEFRDMDRACNLADDEFRKVRKIFIGD